MSTPADILLDGHEPLVVVSPHLDDGVFSCGELLSRHPGSTVITLFAGGPTHCDTPTSWDAAAGFQPHDDVIEHRRREDATALSLLQARPVWLPFLDAQYAPSPVVDEMACALADSLDGAAAAAVLFPLGLFHSDHVLASDACLLALQRQQRIPCFAYADAIYRRIDGLVDQRLAALQEIGLSIDAPVTGRGCSRQKRSAVQAYASQLRALSTPPCHGYNAVFEPERYYRLRRRA